MNKKIISFIIIFLGLVCILSGCKKPTKEPNKTDLEIKQEEIFQSAKESGYTGSYEEWLETIKGIDGTSITKVEINSKGELLITLSNGKTTNLGVVKGSDGKDGLGIKDAKLNSKGELVVTFTDNTTKNLGVIKGSDGKDGIDGIDGVDGIGIDDLTIDKEGYLIVKLSDGTTKNLGLVGKPGRPDVEGVVPVYQGMTLESNEAVEQYNVKARFNAINHNFKDSINDFLDIITTEKVEYYADKGENFNVVVHIYNPSSYEILSFTLNGYKYQSYEFKEGSDSTRLIIEVNAGLVSGLKEYTIDGIKYIDGTEIKDVQMDGEKTVKAGVRYEIVPTASIIQEEVGTTSYNAIVEVKDDSALMDQTNGIHFFVFDGSNIVAHLPLKLGINQIEIKDLLMGTDYEYMVVGVYDDYSGYGKQAGNLIQNKIKTLDGYLVESLTSTQNSISLKLEQLDETATIKQIQLLLNNQVIETKEYSKVVDFANLLSDNEYQVEVTYTYLKDEVERTNKVVLDIATKAKQAPTISLNKFTSSKKEVEYGLEISDIDNVSTDLTITLYHDSVKVAESKNLTDIFDRLYSNSEYRLEVKNSYDLNDGAGVQEITLVDTIKTKELEVPTVDLAYSFTKNEISYTTVYTDEDNTVQKVVYKLYKGTSIIETAKSKDYVFANLQSNTEYKIVLVYYYDLNDNQKIITAEKEYVITTLKDVPTINLAVSNITSSTVNVTSSLNDINNVGKIISVGIYLNNVLIEEQLDVNNFKFENLNANTKYKVVVKAQYDLNDGNGSMTISKEIEFTSLMKKPVVSLDLTSTKKTINYQVIYTDENKVFKLEKVEILKDGVTVQETTSLSNIFENLQSSTNYVVKVTYSFEINDGLGKQTIELSNNIKTKDLTVPTVGMNVISSSDKSITTKIVTSDNDNILNIKEINIYQANNLVQTFSSSEVYNDLVLNTAPNTEYRYVVSYEYDLNNGLGVQQETYEYKVTSSKEMPVINLTSYFVTQHEMEYNLMISDPNASGRVNMISLYQGSTFVERLDETSTKVDNLLSNTPYTIKVNYIYDFNDGLGSREINYTYNFTTLKEEPTFEIVESTRTKDSLEIRYDINDVDSALSLIKLELLLDEKVLKTYTNLTNVLFEDLLSNNQYKLVATFNKNINTGDETHTRVIYMNTLSLETPSVDIDLDSTRTTVSYSYLVNDPDKISTVKSIDLYYQGNKLDIKAINNQYSNLYTDSEYELVITLLNDYQDGKVAKEETYRKTIRTDYHQIPSVDVELTSTVDTINFKFIESDIYDLLKVNKVNIYKGQSLIKEVTDLTKGKVTGLESNTLYRVEIVYEYDLNDNNGKHTQSFERSYSTLAHNVKVLGYELLNSGAPKTNEEISLNIKLENESKVELAYIVVNGEKLTVSGGDKQNNIVVVIRAPKTSGIFNISVDKIGYFLNGVEVEQMIENIEDINIEIMSRLDIVSANTLDLSTVIPSYSQVGLMLIIDNPYGYKIDSYVIHGTTYKAYMIDDNHIYLPDYYVCYNSYINISKVTYFDDKGNITSRNYDYSYSMNITYLSSSLSKIRIIQTPEDFINMESGYAYELGNDIDMSGYSCDAKSFSGYFDGKGHTIKNLSVVHENEYSYDTWSGIFSQLDGTFKNVFFDNVYLHIESNNVYTHLLYGNGNPELSNVLFKGAVVLTYDNYHSFEMPSGKNIYIVDSLTLNKVKYQYEDTITLSTFNSENFKLNTLGWDFGAKKFGEYQGFIYTIIDNSYIFINGYEGENPELVIPENINGYPVIGISDYAFENLNTITSILVPDGIKHIGEGFINNCDNLESITIEDLQTSNLFYYNTLTSVKYLSLTSSKKSMSIGFDRERFNMNSLIRIYLDGVIVSVENLEKLEELTIKNVELSGSFRSCDSLKIITFENVTNIQSWSFDNNYALIDVNINEGTKIIDEYAFINCNSLTNVSLPSTLTEIKAYAFQSCGSIQSIIIPKSVEKIGAVALNHIPNIFVQAESKPTNWSDNFTDTYSSIIYNFHSLYSDGQFDYVLTNNGTATILAYYGNSTNLDIKEKVVVDNKSYIITSILGEVFKETNITNITLPDTIESIGQRAFYNSKLTTIRLPESLKKIGAEAFAYCRSLQSVILPEGLETISTFAFNECISLGEIFIPKTVKSIGSYAFGNGCSITIYCEYISKPSSWDVLWSSNSNTTVIWDSCGVYNDGTFKYLLTNNGAATILAYNGNSTNLDIKEKVVVDNKSYIITSIFNDVFNEANIVNVTLPDTIEFIGQRAFYNSKLTTIRLPESLKKISAEAFANCEFLQSVILPEGLESIGSSAFSYCRSLSYVSIPSSLIEIQNSAFTECFSLEEIFIPKTVKSIGSYAFGNGCSITIYCEYISKPSSWDVSWSSNSNSTVIWDSCGVYYDETFKYFLNTNNTAKIIEYIGSGNTIVVPNTINYNNNVYSVNEIYESTFTSCYENKSIYIPSSVSVLSASVFADHSNFSIYCEVKEKPSGWDANWAGNCSTKMNCAGIYSDDKFEYILSKDFTATVTKYIGEDTDVVINQTIKYNNKTYTITEIGDSVFSTMAGMGNPVPEITSIVMPNSITYIGGSAFAWCSKLTSVVLPKSLTHIGSYAFQGCENLTNITLPDNLEKIGEGAFSYCSSLTSIIIPNKVKEISTYTFGYSTSLKEVVLPAKLTTIGNNAFESCSGLLLINIPESVETIGSYAFNGCSKLASINIPASVETIENGAFNNCTSLINVKLSEGLICIGDHAFAGCSGLKEIVIPSTVESICYRAFEGCTSLIKVKLTKGLISIGDYAFTNCTSLKDIVIPEGVENIGSYAFQECNSLTEINIPQSTKYVGYYAFGYYNGINAICGPMQKPAGWDAQWLYSGSVIWGYKGSYSDGKYTYDLYNDNTAVVTSYIGVDLNLVIPNSINYEGESYIVTKIGEYAFENCKDIITVKLPNQLEVIESYAFSNCTNIIEINLPETLKIIDVYAFNCCESLVDLTLPTSLEYIKDNAFWNCWRLESINLPNSLKEIGYNAFAACHNIREVFVPKGIEVMGSGVFGNNYEVNIYCAESSKPSGWDNNWAFKDYATIIWCFDKMYNDNLFEYALMTDGTAIIHKYIGTATNLDINNSVKVDGKTYTIIGVADRVFEGNKIIKSVKLPNTITSVGSYTFKNCVNLESIVIPEGVTIIKAYAFEGCSNLTNVSLPSTLLKIDNYAFHNCSALTNIILPSKLVVIGNDVFTSCNSLSSIVIPKSVISVGTWAFGNGCQITVYCEASSKPASWSSDWIYTENGTVIWGYTK